MAKLTPEQIARKFGIPREELFRLEREQRKLARHLSIKDAIDFNLVDAVAGIDNSFYKNRIVSAVVVMNPELEIIEQTFHEDKTAFPYIPGFRAYRELPAMVHAINNLETKPDVIFVKGHGIAHPRLGIASHLSLATNMPTVGIANELIVGEIQDNNIVLNGKIVGKVWQSKKGSKPLLISPGNMITPKTALELVKRFTREPHKLPEPIHAAGKFAKRLRKELFPQQ